MSPIEPSISATAAIEAECEAIDKKLEAENARWDKERARLQAALERTRGWGAVRKNKC
ncbi:MULTISPECIES: hypothetical protein [Bradyrhizobium]|uniref:hypothetical protein n=1 Tax=Bradyrhizobium TaxID=374 RepID=UPI0012D34217|nr:MULTISPECIES: hypothetical protein [Bradyrhizobium]